MRAVSAAVRVMWVQARRSAALACSEMAAPDWASRQHVSISCSRSARAALKRIGQPDEIAGMAVLLASTLKFEGVLTLQLQGNGPVRLLVAQCTDDFRVRATTTRGAVSANATPFANAASTSARRCP